MVFSFVSRWIQPLQRWKHPAFIYEGTKDPTWLSPEAMSHSEVVRRCCKVLDDFDKSLVLLSLFTAVNPPEKTWVSIEKHCRVLGGELFGILMNFLFAEELQDMVLHASLFKRSVKQLLDHCCRGKYIVSIVASKNLNLSN